MSNIKIDRFEKRYVKNNLREPTKIEVQNNTTVLIKDHKTDEIIGLIQLNNDIEKNKELADRIINTIEEYVLEDTENEP